MGRNHSSNDPTQDCQGNQCGSDQAPFLCSAEKEAKEKSDESRDNEDPKIVKDDLFHGFPRSFVVISRNGDSALLPIFYLIGITVSIWYL